MAAVQSLYAICLLRFYKDPSSQSSLHYELPTSCYLTLQLGEVDYFAQDDKARAMTLKLPCSTKEARSAPNPNPSALTSSIMDVFVLPTPAHVLRP